MEGAVSEKRNAFATAHRNDKDRKAYAFASRRASSVIAKAKVDSWQRTCSSLSPKSNTKSVYFLLCFVAGSSSSFSVSPNFPDCFSSWESALVLADYLRSTFLSPSQRSCVAEPEAPFSSSAESRALRSLTRRLYLLSPLNFLRLPLISPCSLSLVQTKLPISC